MFSVFFFFVCPRSLPSCAMFTFHSTNCPLTILPFLFGISILLSGFFVDVGSCSEAEKDENSAPSLQQKRHEEVHQAKNLIDALSLRLHLNMQTYAAKRASMHQVSSAYLNQIIAAKNQLKDLSRLKNLFNELTNKASKICEKFYTDFDFTVARAIIIKTSSALPKDSTMKLQGITREYLCIFASSYSILYFYSILKLKTMAGIGAEKKIPQSTKTN